MLLLIASFENHISTLEDVFNKKCSYNPEIATELIRYHLTDRIIREEEFTPREIELINEKLGFPEPNPVDFRKNGLDHFMFQNRETKEFNILCSPFPRRKRFHNPGLMGLYHMVHSYLSQNANITYGDDIIRLIEEIRFKSEFHKINQVNLNVSGFGKVGATRAQILLLQQKSIILLGK